MTNRVESVRRESLATMWKKAWASRGFRWECILSILGLIAVIRLCSFKMVQMEVRKGAHLMDPILTQFQPIDLRWVTFTVLWSSMALGIYLMLRRPRRFLMGLQAAGLILILRTITIYLVPLEPLPSIIPLADPLVEYLGTGKRIVKDLLFSGHTAMMFLLCVSASQWWAQRLLLLLGTITVGVCVVLQHVHYSGDVFFAPFMAYGSWRAVWLVHEKLGATP